MSRIAFLPLDDRPCCRQFVHRLAQIAGLELSSPPPSLLGGLDRPGDSQAIVDWLPKDCPTVLASLDMVCWGGLVASRDPGQDEAAGSYRLQRFLEATSGRRVYAFQSLMRVAPTQTSPEEVHWALRLLELSRWEARAARGSASAAVRRDVLRSEFAPGVVERYLRVRGRNFHLNREALRAAAHGRLAHLLIGIDDSKTEGWNVLEAAELEALTRELRAPVHLAPGTDESAHLQLARLGAHSRPVAVVWSGPATGCFVTRYEDRPLRELLSAQAAAAALELVPSSDRELWIYGPFGPQQEANVQRTGLMRARRFVARLERALDAGKTVAVADVSYANGADRALASRLLETGVAARLAAYSGWNTAGNAIGTALAALVLVPDFPSAESERARRLFLAERLADDYLYQSVVRPRLRRRLGPGLRLSDPAAAEQALREELGPLLEDLLARLGVETRVEALRLPWGRLFEAEVRLGG